MKKALLAFMSFWVPLTGWADTVLYGPSARPAQSHWQLRDVLGAQVANLSENYLSASTTTSAAWAARNRFEGSYWRAMSGDDAAWELRGALELGYVFPAQGISWPLQGALSAAALRRNLGSLEILGHRIGISPLAQPRVEALSLASPNYASGGAFTYQTRSVWSLWLDLGARLRADAPVHWWEITPTLSVAPWSRSSLQGVGADDGWGYGGGLQLDWGVSGGLFAELKSELFVFPGADVGLGAWRTSLGAGYSF